MEIDTEKKWRKRIGRFSPRQLEMIVSYMEQNTSLAQGKLSIEFSKSDRRQKWKELSEMLNAERFGPKKTSDQWRKTWNDQKALIRCKAAKIKNSGSITSHNGIRDRLTPIEERLLKLAGYMSSAEDNGSSVVSFSSVIETSVDTLPETVLPDLSTELATETSLNSFVEPKIEPDLQEPSKQGAETTLPTKTAEPTTKAVLQTEPVIESKIEIVLPEQRSENAACQQTPQNCYKRLRNDAERRNKIRR
ncbi:hypothetical protein X975_17840, partial [Stegodyphus mimosarum]